MPNRNVVNKNGPFGRVEQARNEAHERRFSASGFADESDGFALFDRQIYIFQNRFAVIGKSQIAKFDLAFDCRLLAALPARL